MEDLVQLYQPVPQSIPSNNQLEIDDQQGQDLFNQIQLDELSFQNKQQSDQMKFPAVATAQDIQQNTKKLKKALQLDSDEQQNKQTIMKTPRDKQKHKYSKSDRKRSKKQKKLRKKLKKQKQQSKNNFKRLKKQGETDKKSESDKWSGENQQSDSEDSGASSDSLLQGLNPTKIKNGKVRSTQKKQGFSLKQLGNDGQVDYEQDNVSGDSQFKDRKNKKTIKARAEKKQVTNNQQVLKSLFQLGLCVQQENYEHKTKQDDGYDNGLQQIEKLKGSKKKGPKIANKLFADLQINQEEEQSNKLMHNKIQLEIKPRINNGLSHLALSFLAKTEKIKKVRGMESQMQNEEYQKMISMKAKQSMKKLISQKEVEQAEDIQLDVKVPEVIKGSGEINNSIFLKKISSTISHKQANEVKPATPVKQIVKQIKPQQKTKLSRVQFFKSITEDVKARRSKQFCDELIKNNFKITNLDEIEQLRKKNEEKKKRQILAGSEQEEEESEKQQNHKDEDVVFQNKLGFMNFAIEVQDAGFQKQSQPEVQANGNKIQSEQNAINNEKVQNKNDKNKKVEQVSAADKVREVKKFSIQLNDAIPDKQYRKLLQLEQGQEIQQNENMEDAMQNSQQLIDNQIDMQNQSEFAPIRNLNQQLSEDSHNQISEKQIQQAEAVDLQVDLQVSKINNQQEQQLLNSSSENIQAKDKGKEQPINQQYQLYLNELEAEGINLKKTYNKSNKIRNDKKIDINQYLIESKQNDQIRENGGQEKPQIEESQARKQFRKLRKLAVILKNKKIHEQKIKKAQQFFDEEAEEGSDDQNHDNLIKQIDYDQEAKEFQGMDLDADLVELIDDVDIDEEEDIAFRKFMEDQKIRDIEEIKRIMKGDFKRRRDVQPLIDQIDEDEKNRIQRMEEYKQYLQRMQKQQGKDLYMKDDNEDNDDKGDQSEGENEKGNSNKDNKKAGNVQQDMEMIDEINEQNLKKYFDECAGQTFKSKVTNVRPIVQLPASYQRQKKTVMRNTIKVKQQNEGMKLKKTTSHLNEQIMKNKEKIKPLIMLKPFGLIGPNKKK